MTYWLSISIYLLVAVEEEYHILSALELTSSLTSKVRPFPFKPSAREPRTIVFKREVTGTRIGPLNRNTTYAYVFVKTFRH